MSFLAKTQSLAIVLLTIICGSTFLHVTHAAQDQVIMKVPSPTTDVVEPLVNDDGLALLNFDGGLSKLSEAELVGLGFKFKCIGVIINLGGCIGDITKGILNHDFSGVDTNCCNAVLNPKTFKCLLEVLLKNPLIKYLPIPDHLRVLQQFCASIPAEAMYTDKKIGEFFPNGYSSSKELKD
ncbi:hypothetical protein ACFE04_009933 [Oxalis oulophora]